MEKATVFKIFKTIKRVLMKPYSFVLIVLGFLFEFFITFPYYITCFLDNLPKKK